MFETSWTPAADAELGRLWAEGLTTPEIARRMGLVSKCAVIGRARRIGLPGRAAPIKRRHEYPYWRASSSKPAPASLAVPKRQRDTGAGALPRTLAEPAAMPVMPTPMPRRSRGPCVWVGGQPGNWLRCEALAAIGDWCAEHHALCKVAPPRRPAVSAPSAIATEHRGAAP